MKIHAISDLHLRTMGLEQFNKFQAAFPTDGVLVVVGDSDAPEVLVPVGDIGVEVVIIPGNSDPPLLQDAKVFRIIGETTILGCMGANWVDTPWAHHHLHDQPCDTSPVLEWLKARCAECYTCNILLAIHYPLSYMKDDVAVVHPGFEEFIKNEPRITSILHGHVHLGEGEIPTQIHQAKVLNVSADRLDWSPIEVVANA